jgi:ATP-dependent Clp protease ATP-binding subunit ClpA
MFERFTDKAKAAVIVAKADASERGDQIRPVQATGRITMTREAKQSIELAVQEARALHHSYVGTEHLLLGLIGAAQRRPPECTECAGSGRR